nr:hypothetical protein [Tanacetum cinerariifolium]
MPLLTYLNLGLGELGHTKLTVELEDRTVKNLKGIAKHVLVGIGKFIFPIDFIILDMLEDVNVPLILRRPFLSTSHAKVYVFKRKITLRVGDEKIIFKSVKPASILIKRVYMLRLRERMDLDIEAIRNQVDDLEPTIEEGKVVNNPMIDIVKARTDLISGLDDYPSECDFDRRIHIDFVEDMGPYLDEGMGDVIVEEPFCKASCVEAKRFDGIITISYGDDSVTYQMMRANPRFKPLTNEKCNKIPPLPKVSGQDKMNGISHSHQKLKGFYKGVLNLGPKFIQDVKVEEWLIRGTDPYSNTFCRSQYGVSWFWDMAYQLHV